MSSTSCRVLAMNAVVMIPTLHTSNLLSRVNSWRYSPLWLTSLVPQISLCTCGFHPMQPPKTFPLCTCICICSSRVAFDYHQGLAIYPRLWVVCFNVSCSFWKLSSWLYVLSTYRQFYFLQVWQFRDELPDVQFLIPRFRAGFLGRLPPFVGQLKA